MPVLFVREITGAYFRAGNPRASSGGPGAPVADASAREAVCRRVVAAPVFAGGDRHLLSVGIADLPRAPAGAAAGLVHA